MCFLFFMCMSLVSGEITHEQFTRQTNASDSTSGNVSGVRCAISCLYAEKCLSYTIHSQDVICDLSTTICGLLKEGMVCYNRKSTLGLERSDTEGVRRDYILFIPNYLPGHSVRKRDIETGSVTEYHGLHYEIALSGAVMPLSRKLLLCIGTPYEIITFSLVSQAKKTLRKAEAVAMAVDESLELVFVSLALNEQGAGKILRMTNEGGDVKTIRQRGELALSLMTDVKQHKLYVAYDGSIDVVDYVTLAEETIVTDKSLGAFTLDPEREILYYSQAYFLMGISLSEKKTRKVVNMWNKPTTLDYYKNHIYVASSGRVNFQKVKNVHTRHASLKFLDMKEAGRRPLMFKVTM